MFTLLICSNYLWWKIIISLLWWINNVINTTNRTFERHRSIQSALFWNVRRESVLTVGGYVYGCSAGLGSKGKEKKEEVWEVRGAPPPTANLLLLCVRHCSLSHQSPTCSHTRAVKCTESNLTHTHLCTASVRPCASVVPLVVSWSLFLFPPFLLLSLSQVHALLLVSSLKDKREGGGEWWTRGAKGRGRAGPCVRMGEKLLCAMWSDPYTDWDIDLTDQLRVNNTKQIKQCVSLSLFL